MQRINGRRLGRQVYIIRGHDMLGAGLATYVLMIAVVYDGSVPPEGQFAVVERRRRNL